MKDIVPLYYKMGKAEPSNLNSDAMFEGLRNAYIGGNIGVISNDISKIWNSGEVSDDALNSIKILCAFTNFTIDFAKTLYKPTIPKDKAKIIHNYTKNRLPHFFVSAKDKLETHVEPIKDNTTMGRLEKMIPNKRLLFKVHNLQKFDYKMLMNNPNTEIRQDIVDVYDKVSNYHCFKGGLSETYSNTQYITQQILDEMLEVEPNINILSDVLIEYLYGKLSTRRKNVLWYCFGEVINQNLKYNLTKKYGEKSKPCIICGERIEITTSNNMMCSSCQRKKQLELQRKSMKKNRESKKHVK